MPSPLVTDFTKWWIHKQRPWNRTFWRGIKIQKNPCDLMMYQMLIWKFKPAVIVELGTFYGGSAAFFSDICDIMNLPTKIVTVDTVILEPRPTLPRVTYLKGSSTHNAIVHAVYEFASPFTPRFVIADSLHTTSHIMAELEAYNHLVTPGSYYVVEDTYPNETDESPISPTRKALAEWCKKDGRFVVDNDCEMFGLTNCPGGYLRRLP